MKTLLFILISFIGISATFLGLTMVGYPHWNTTSAFIERLALTFNGSFYLPGILLSIAGLINIFAVFSRMQSTPQQYGWSLAGGLSLGILSITSVVFFDFMHWIQLLMLGIGLLIVLLSYQLKGKWAA